MIPSASRAAARSVGQSISAAPACTATRLTVWETRSCNSRAIWRRSAWTASAVAARSSSVRSAAAVAATACRRRWRPAMAPVTTATVRMTALIGMLTGSVQLATDQIGCRQQAQRKPALPGAPGRQRPRQRRRRRREPESVQHRFSGDRPDRHERGRGHRGEDRDRPSPEHGGGGADRQQHRQPRRRFAHENRFQYLGDGQSHNDARGDHVTGPQPGDRRSSTRWRWRWLIGDPQQPELAAQLAGGLLGLVLDPGDVGRRVGGGARGPGPSADGR